MNHKPKRILCIVSAMNAGGAETFLMKVYRALDKSQYQMDFYVSVPDEGFYDKEIISYGGRIIHSIPKSKGFFKAFNALRKTVKIENYEYVMRLSQHSLATLDLLAAKLGGAKVLIQRSTNAGSSGKVNKLLHSLFKFLPILIPNIKIAPSTEAAEYTFGKNCVSKGEATIINNAIPVETFLFNPKRREKIQKEFNLNGHFVVGHVGRLNVQKNHSFLIDVFSEIIKKHENSILMLVGKGELEKDIKNKINSLGLEDKVIFTGVRTDVPDLMMAMDVFVFPSLYEGMPNTVIEAQATGLPCVISDTITKEANITGSVEYISLDDSAQRWASKALKYSSNYERKDIKNVYVEHGYDIDSVSKKLIKLITSF